LGALLLGVHENGRLMYAGKVGTGFTRESLQQLAALLGPLEQSTSPFANPPRGSGRGVHWVQPRLVAEIEFAERTQAGLVRHATFRGLREDKPPEQVQHESAEQVPGKNARPKPPTLDPSRIHLSHPDRILYPEQGITKRDLALYYASVSRYMLPHVVHRPLMLVRCPEGAGQQCFHQKHPSRGMPKAVERVLLQEKKGPKEHLVIADVEGLIALVQMGALEIHTWGCRADQPDCPDQLVFDLDPDPELAWDRVLEAAWKIRANLAPLGLTGFVKTTGGKGLHIVVPVLPHTPWERAKQFSSVFVEAMVSAEPSKYLMTMTRAKRAGKIFLDYFRNGRGATAACAYSTRARAGATVSLPIDWDELTSDMRSDRFDLHSVPERLRSISVDPWQDFEAARAPIPDRLGSRPV
jgi:bifunctional non-homologous end joining protein LigD